MIKNFFTILSISLILSLPGLAQDRPQLNEFKKIIIVKEGRLKPLETYAKNLLLRFSGRTSIDKKPALEWLALSLFDPEEVYDKKIFLINNPEVLEAIGVEPDKHRRYSFNDLQKGMKKLFDYAKAATEKDDEDRTALEKEFTRVFFNLHSYIQLINSMLFNHKHKDFTVSDSTRIKLYLETNENSLFDIMQRAGRLSTVLEKVEADQDLKAFETDIVKLSINIYRWIENYKNYESIFNEQEKLSIILDSCNNGSDCNWTSPWDQVLDTDSNSKNSIFYLNRAHLAFNDNDQENFDKNIIAFNNAIKEKIKENKIRSPKIEVEIFYNKLKPFFNAKLLYGFAFLAIMLSTLVFSKALSLSSILLSSLAFTIQSIGILCRIIILGRAPVSNLFETFIFVSFIAVALGLILSYMDRTNKLGPVLASSSGLILLLISGKFAAEGDTMEMLIAVLNSNFWLSTHVICITIGYAGVFAAGIVGHYALIQELIFKKKDKKLTSIIFGILGFGLCFSFLGTMLGGIWADQSWGRFWGWDPKENGALLIVLWTTTLFHARLAGLVKETGLAIGAVIGDMVVITSWFGINLLGVGLHSYGFTNGVANGLYAFYAIETIFIIAVIIARLGSSRGNPIQK